MRRQQGIVELTNSIMHSSLRRSQFGFGQEVALLALIGLLTSLYFLYPDFRQPIQYVLFLPIILGAFVLGWEKASAFTIVGVGLVIALSTAMSQNLDAKDLLINIIWGTTLGATSAVVGLTVSTHNTTVVNELKKQSVLASTDQLTEMANRRAFDMELERRMAEFDRSAWHFALLMIDIDYFKKFNDDFGHSVGDQVLRNIAGVVKECMRDVDLVSRHGGEEFAVLMPDTCVDDAQAIAEQIRIRVNEFAPGYLPKSRKLSVSIGVTTVTQTDTCESILQRADFAMYTAKENGRNRVFVNTGRTTWTDEEVDLHRQSKFEGRQPNRQYFSDTQSLLDSTTDPITTLTYQKIFREELVRRVFEVNRYKYKLSLASIRIPGLNDYCLQNELSPSAVLSGVGPLLRQSLRNSDLVTWQRYNEFVLCLPFSSSEDSMIALERISWEISYLDRTVNSAFPKEVRLVEHRTAETAEELLMRLNKADVIDFSVGYQDFLPKPRTTNECQTAT